VVPTSFRYNAEHDAIDVGGMRISQTKKLRDVQRTGRASIRPTRIVAFGIDPGDTTNARSVSAT